MSRPAHLGQGDASPLITSRRGFFWLGVDQISSPLGTLAAGAMYVAWEAPEQIRRPYPVVLIHGGGGQGTDWMGTPDGRPGWGTLLVQQGYAVYVVDRPGFGRSPLYPEALGEMAPPLSYEVFEWLFGSSVEGPVPNPGAAGHTAWPGSGDRGDPAVDQMLASFGPMLADGAAAQLREQERLAELLDEIGPAIVVAHSAGGPAGLLAADARPDLVAALVLIEPPGPPFWEGPGGGLSLSWGLTAAPLRFDPLPDDPGELAQGPRKLPSLSRVPIALVSAAASPLAAMQGANAQFLIEGGCLVDQLKLDELGVEGCGHGLIVESNNGDSLGVVTGWLDSKVRPDLTGGAD